MRDLLVAGLLLVGTVGLALYQTPTNTPTPLVQTGTERETRPASDDPSQLALRARREMILNANAVR
jgi:hypothetical protein